MPIAFYVTLFCGLALLLVWMLFRAESVKGKRLLLRNVRDQADMALERQITAFAGVSRFFGASSLRLFLHYVLHQALGAGLFIVRFLEKILHGLRTKNKVAAKDIRVNDEDSHLASIAKHKETTALSPEERASRKERSLQD